MNKVKFAIFTDLHYEHFCYSNDIHKKYPFVKDLVLYKDGLFAVVTISEDYGIEIEGMNGAYQNISPKDLGIEGTWNGRPVLPIVSSLKVE